MFSFIKNCLLTYNYPLVHSMNEEEIADIFKSSNRCFLISWMLKILDGAYQEVLENLENDKEFLSNIICELGFCPQKEKLFFMTGDMDVDQQVKIIFNLFKFITDIKKSTDEENKITISNEELTSLANADLNLFPMYGEMKLLKPAERILKTSELEKVIDSIKELELTDVKAKKKFLSDNKFKEDFQEFVDILKLELPNITSAMKNVGNNKRNKDCKAIQLKPNSAETLKKCCENLKIISQFIKDVNTIEEFENCDFELKEYKRNNDTYEMIKVLYREVLTVVKYSRCL